MRARTAGQRPLAWWCARFAALASVTLVLTSCASQSSPDPATSGSAGHLQINQTMVGHAVPIEGALSYIRIERASGATLSQRQLPGRGALTLTVPPGAYRLVSWQRLCDANCGNLDPPSHQCARPFTLRPGQHLQARIRVNYAGGCVILLHPEGAQASMR